MNIWLLYLYDIRVFLIEDNMTTNKKSETGLKYNKVQKMNKNFMYQDLKRSNCYNSDFSNYNFTSLRGA